MPSKHSSYLGAPNNSPIRQWDGAIPIVMSVVVLLMVAVELWKYGLHHTHRDEGAADHIAMLLMFGQIPIMLWFTASRRHGIRPILPTLAIQLSLWAITFASAVTLT